MVHLDEPTGLVLASMPVDAVLCDHSAAQVHGLWLPPGDVPVRVCVPGRPVEPRRRPHSRRTALRYRRRELRPEDVTVVDGVPVTSLARTWIDLAELVRPADLVAVGDSVLRSGAALDELDDQVQRAGRRRGVVRARTVLPHLDRRSRSRPESCMRYELVSAGLPKPEVNEPVIVGGEWIGEPDLLYRRQRIALEYQGDAHADVSRMRKDITRRLDFGDVDWLVIEAGPNEVFRHPERLVHLVRFEYDRRTR